MTQKFVGAVLVVVAVGCVGDPTGSGGAVTLHRVAAPGDTLIVGAPGRLLGQPIAFRVVDGYGKPLPAARVHWTITSGNGTLVQADSTSGSDGTLKANWMLGTRASDVQRLQVDVQLGGGHTPTAQVTAAAVPVEVAALALQAETTEVRLTVSAQIRVQATDPFGNHFVPRDLRFVSLDTTLTVDSAGTVVPHRRGFARVIATAGALADTAVVHGIQVVAAIRLDRDTLRFHSLGEAQRIGVTLLDDRGLTVVDSLPHVVPSDSTVVALQPANPLVLTSKANGRSTVTLSTSTVSQSAVVVVRQHTASLAFTVPSFPFDALNDTVQARLIALDSLGVPVQAPRITFSSSDTAVVVIDSSGVLRSRRNGSAIVRALALSGVATTAPVVVAQQVVRIAVAQDTVSFDALHAQLPAHATALDRLGSPVVGAALTYTSASSGVAAVDTSGQIQALANGTTRIAAVHAADTGLVVVVVKQRPVRVVVATDTVRLHALGQTHAIPAVAVDSLGSPLNDGVTAITPADTTVARAADSATVLARANGVTTAAFTIAGIPGSVVIRVAQVPAGITLLESAFGFDALNDTARVVPRVSDSLGAAIALASVTFSSSDTTIATVNTAGLVKARGNGSTRLLAQAAPDVVVSVSVTVTQRAVAATLEGNERDGFSFAAVGDSLGAMWAIDKNGFRLPRDRFVVTVSDPTRLSVDSFGTLRALRSGLVSMSMSVDSFAASHQFMVVIPVSIVTAKDPAFAIAGIPDSLSLWAPTALPANDGTTTLFFAGYVFDSALGINRGNLYSATSVDGVQFSFQGTVLSRDTSKFYERSRGVENVFIVPRADAPGCRMFASAGGWVGVWQIFSAVAPDCRSWTWERASQYFFDSTSAVVPGYYSSSQPARPVGEGIYVWQDSSNAWWMLTGAFPPPPAASLQWSIGLYTSADQLHWSYVRTVISPGQPGPGSERAVSGPTVSEVAPGLWRMIFAGDDYGVNGQEGKSRLFSAVSRDRLNWTMEGVVLDLPSPDEGAVYPTVINDRLYYRVHGPNILGYQAMARIRQP